MAGGDGAGVSAAVDEGYRLLEEGEHLLVGGQVFDGSDAAQGAHASVLNDVGFAEDGADFFSPEAEAAVFFKRGQVAEDHAFVLEEGAAPLDGFCDAGAGFVDQFADVVEDGLGEGFGFVNVGVDAGVETVF